MEPNQLHELATNVELNHWPPHLGVRTDAEKIQYLAARLREAANEYESLGGVYEANQSLLEENDMLKSDIKNLKYKLKQIQELAIVK